MDGSGPNDFLLESLEDGMDPPCQPTCMDTRANLEAVGFHYCFRRLSDSLPSSSELFFQVADLERDVLLEEANSTADLSYAGFLDRAAEEEWRGQEEDDERAAEKPMELSHVKDGAAVSSLAAWAEDRPRDAKPAERWKRHSSVQEEDSRLNCENLNNNNSKRSCPEDFEVCLGA